MAPSGRTRRATSQREADVSNLNNVERLVLAQAVFEKGSDAWQDVSALLSKHPMISRPRTFFTPETCSSLYFQLMEEAGLECSEGNTVPRAPANLKLAQLHYTTRVAELKELIAAEETKFRTLVTEIDEIRNGLWDDKIRGSLGINPLNSVEQTSQMEQANEEQREQTPVNVVETGEQSPEAPLDDDVKDVADLAQTEGKPVELEEPENAEQPVQPTQDEATVVEENTLVQDEKPDSMMSDERPDEDAAEVAEEPSQSPDAEAMEEDRDVARVERVEDDLDQPEDILQGPTEDQAAATADEEPEQVVFEPEDVSAPITSEETIQDDIEEDAETEAQGDAYVDAEIAMQERAPPADEEPERTDTKRKASELDDALSDSQQEKKRAREESEPMDEDEAASSSFRSRRPGRPTTSENPIVSKRFQNMISMLHSQISQHRNGNIFHNPIRKVEASDYHDIVKRPMDLKTIKARIKDGLISNSLEFQRDVYLMFANAMMYNRPGSEIYNMAEEMMLASEIQINSFRQTEGFHRS